MGGGCLQIHSSNFTCHLCANAIELVQKILILGRTGFTAGGLGGGFAGGGGNCMEQ